MENVKITAIEQTSFLLHQDTVHDNFSQDYNKSVLETSKVFLEQKESQKEKLYYLEIFKSRLVFFFSYDPKSTKWQILIIH